MPELEIFCYYLYMENIETEYKWAIPNKTVFAKLETLLKQTGTVAGISKISLLDTYFDDKKASLSAEKSALRLRHSTISGKSAYELTLKTSCSMQGGLAKRKEITIPLKAKTRSAVLAEFKKELLKLRPELKTIKRLFSIANKRKAFLIKNNDFEGELSFDNCLIKSSETAALLEAELEFKSGDMEAFNAFALSLGQSADLKPPVKSKVATARALLNK